MCHDRCIILDDDKGGNDDGDDGGIADTSGCDYLSNNVRVEKHPAVSELHFAIQRAVSRLVEMSSAEYQTRRRRAQQQQQQQ